MTDTQTQAGEDDSSTERDGDDSHLHDDQKSPASFASSPGSAHGEANADGEDPAGAGEGPDAGTDEDPNKVQKLVKAGRKDFDPNAGEE